MQRAVGLTGYVISTPMNVVIVIPTVREERFKTWLDRWGREFQNHAVIVVEDNPRKSFSVPGRENMFHYSWQEIDDELKDKAWIIPRRTDCVRSFGFYKAYQMQPDMVVTLDDDCYPDHEKFLELHWHALNERHPADWFQHFPGIRVRGMPYELERLPTVLNIGLWSNIPDLDARTQLDNMGYRAVRADFNLPAPRGYFVPVCGMNVAFRPEIIPAFYFLLMGQGYECDRFGDIWSGMFLKKICDHLGIQISGGCPYVWHDRASDPHVNLEKEKNGVAMNEQLWKDVKAMNLSGRTVKECYISLADQLPVYSEYWARLKGAMKVWVRLFD